MTAKRIAAQRRRADNEEHAVQVLAVLAGMPTVAPTVAELAEAAGIDEAELRPLLKGQEQSGAVETWGEAGAVRVMLAARTAERMGLGLARCGGRWEAAG